MTGFLRSLAAHGTAPGPRIRPIARPYMRGPLSSDRLDQEHEAEIAAVPAASPLDESSTPRGASEAVATDDTVRRAPMTLADAIVQLTDPPKLARASQPPLPAVSEPRIDRRPVANPQTASSLHPPAARRGDTAPQPPRPGRDRSAASDDERRIAPIVTTTPAIPRVAQPRIAEQRSDAARHRQESTPDVHIHIGRIELTAVTTPAPPQRQPAAAKAAMPLDEYLQRRNGRRR